MDYIIDNIDNIAVSQNEIVNRYSINRCLAKLYNNDEKLAVFYEELYKVLGIKDYTFGTSYSYGDIIWFKLNIDGTTKLYLLMSTCDNNTTMPILRYDEDDIPTFTESNWTDKNTFLTMYLNNLESYIKKYILNFIHSEHNINLAYHKFGTLADQAEMKTKLLLADMSNIDEDRKNNFFPNKTVMLTADNTIKSGYYRQYDNGLIEYDIIYLLGYIGTDTYNEIRTDVLYANNLNILSGNYALNIEDDNHKIDNSKYFLNDSDYHIFESENSLTDVVYMNGLLQYNRNDYVNTYSGEINFPVPFADTNYMIFSSDMTCQERNQATEMVDIGINTITYANRTRSFIHPLLIMFPKNNVYKSTDNGLVLNTFHCKIIGRWK